MSQNLFDLTQKFTKYVKFLANHFSIQVEFDSPNCKREANTIYLPALTSMSAQEINVLWGVLLQEAGILKFGEMKSPENLVKFKTQNHAKLIKMIEAARVENKLVAQFDGARDMIAPLYDNCVKDAGLKAKFFPASTNSDIWAGICYYVHQELIGADSAQTQENLLALLGTKTLVKKTNSFIKSSGLDKTLTSPIYKIDKNSTGEDVIKLANKIHTMFFAGQDASPKIDYKKTLEQKEKIEKAALDAQKKFEAFQNELVKQEEQLAKLREKLREEKKKIEPLYRPLQNKKNELATKTQKLNRLSNAQQKQEEISQAQSYNENLVQKNNQKIKDLKESIDSIKERLQNQNNPEIGLETVREKNKEILEQLGFKEDFDMASLENKLEEKQKEAENLTDTTNNIENFLSTQETLEKLTQKIEKQTKQEETLQEKLKDNARKMKDAQDKLDTLSGDTTPKGIEAQEKLKEKLKDLSEKREELRESIQNIEEKQMQSKKHQEEMSAEQAENDFQNEEGKTTEELDAQVQSNEQALKDLKEQIKALNQELAKHNIDDEKKEKLENKQAKQESQVSSLEEKNKAKENKIASLKEEQQSLQNSVNEINQEFNQPSEEEVSNMLEQATKELQETEKSLSDLQVESKKVETEIKQEKTKNEATEKRVQKEVMENAFDIQDACEKMGIDAGILPQFVEMEGWDEANDIQREFDKQQSIDTQQIVTNGAGFQFKGYDTITELINKISDVSEINIQDLFKDVISNNPLDSFAKDAKEKTEDTGDYTFSKSVRPHSVASKEFDKIEIKNRLTNPDKIKEFTEMRMKLAGPARDIKNIVKSKFKFTKKPFYRGGKEDGDLDSRSLYKLATGLDDNYYEKNNPKFVNKISATILLDISGSINKDYTEEGKKLKKAAYLLSEGLKEAHISHEILAYGAEFSEAMSEKHYSDFYNRRNHALKTVVLKKFEDKSNDGLGNFEPEPIDNCDGESLELAYTRVKKRTEKQKVVFIISDAKPFLNDASPEVLDEDLRRVVRRITEDKNHVFALGFNDGPEQLYGNRYQKINEWKDLGMFLNSIDLTGNGLALSTPHNKLKK